MIQRVRMARKRLMVALERQEKKWWKWLASRGTSKSFDVSPLAKKAGDRWERAEWAAVAIMRRKDKLA